MPWLPDITTPTTMTTTLTKEERDEIIQRCKDAEACEPEFKRLIKASSDEDFIAVLAKNAYWCASNRIIPTDVLARLAEDEDATLRWLAAGNPSTPTDVLARLAEDAIIWVRTPAALNPLTPPDALARLAEDSEYWVRMAVAINRLTPADVLAQLAVDKSADVRSAVAARHPSTLKK
jgi:hypothetical protein